MTTKGSTWSSSSTPWTCKYFREEKPAKLYANEFSRENIFPQIEKRGNLNVYWSAIIE